jgi:hypothetical protein
MFLETEHILCSQYNNGAAFVPDSETSFAKALYVLIEGYSLWVHGFNDSPDHTATRQSHCIFAFLCLHQPIGCERKR